MRTRPKERKWPKKSSLLTKPTRFRRSLSPANQGGGTDSGKVSRSDGGARNLRTSAGPGTKGQHYDYGCRRQKILRRKHAGFQQPEKVHAAHILISTKDSTTNQDFSPEKKKEKKKLAEKVLQRAKKGEDFGKLAKEFSEDPGSKDAGGEYTFPRGQMVPEFEAAAFSMKTNQISDLVETSYGYHIIKLHDKIPSQKVEYAKVEKEIKERLQLMEIQKQLPDYLDKLKKEAGVEIAGEKSKGDAPKK